MRKPMPKVYGRHRILDYWYIPVAILIAVVVAGGVIFGAEQLMGGDDDDGGVAGTDNTPTSTITTTVAESPSPGTTGTTIATTSVTPGATDGAFAAGDAVVVNSPEECLNFRPAPGTGNEPIGCLEHGSAATVIGGPQTANDFVWWNVSTAQGDGWVAEDYLQPAP